MFSVSSLHLSRGTVRPGYGLRVTVRCQDNAEEGQLPHRLRALRIDAAGGALERAPARIRLAMQLMMPYAVRRVDGLGPSSALPRARAHGERAELELSFILGAKHLPCSMADSALAEMEPDSPFLVELLCAGTGEEDGGATAGSQLFARAATTAGLIRASVASEGRACALAPSTPALLRLAARRDGWRARSSRWLGRLWYAWLWARWCALPVAFTALCWAVVLPPWEHRLTALARARGRGLLHAAPRAAVGADAAGSADGGEGGGGLRGSTLAHVLPPVPTSMLAAFELGKLAEQLTNARTPTDQAALLAAAAPLVGRAPGEVAGGPAASLSAAELSAVGARLAELEAHVGVLARVRGAFTFINLCWLLAICGIAVSVGPTAWHLLRPFRRWLRRVARWLVRNVLEPVVERAHRWGVLEALAWAGVAALVVDAATAFSRETGLYVALCGVALAAGPCCSYSTVAALWSRGGPLSVPLGPAGRELITRLLSGWLCCTLAPLALRFDSRLLGYLTVFAAFSLIGFSATCRGLCWVVGFSSQRAMERVAATSALLLSAFVGARELGVGLLGVPAAQAQRLAAPFASAVAVVGALTLHLALLIISSRYYRDERRDEDSSLARRGGRWPSPYARRNALAAGAIALGVLSGALSGSAGLCNTSVVFGVLWLVEKYTELHLENGWHGWTLVFALSLGVYRASLWLHDHPLFVASLFEP